MTHAPFSSADPRKQIPFSNTSQYDVAGNRLTITYQSTQRTLTTAFDSHNRPTQIVDTQTGSSTTRTTTYGYNRNGSTVTKGLPNGVTETRGYDVLNRVNSIEAKGPGSSPVVFQSTTQSYDAASNVAQIVETYPSTGVASRTVTNAYDRTYRLQSETAVVGSTTTITSWSYDKANNRLTESKQINGGTLLTTTYTIGDGTNGFASNQIKQFVRPGTGGTVGFTYNAFGNRATRADSATTVLTTYSYDPFSRLTQVLQSDSGTGQTRTHRYAYDYRTRRVVRHEPATLINGTPFPEGGLARRIVFSGGLSVLEYSGTGTTDTSLALQVVRGSDMGGGIGGILYALPYSVSGPQPTYFNFNSRGDVTTQTANTPGTTPTYQAAYEAFGSHPQQMGTAVTRHKANTKEEDPTGLLNEGFRYRDIETGSFITRDPAGFVDGPNLHTYVRQNPWSRFDPSGLKLVEVGETYVVVDRANKKVYVGETARNALDRVRDTGHPAGDISFNEGTQIYSRKIYADENWKDIATKDPTLANKPDKSKSALNRIKRVAELREYEEFTSAPEFSEYEFINNEKSGKMLTSKNAEKYGKQYNVKRSASGRLHVVNKKGKAEAVGKIKSRDAMNRLSGTIGAGVAVAGVVYMFAHGGEYAEDISETAKEWKKWAQNPYSDTFNELSMKLASELHGDPDLNYAILKDIGHRAYAATSQGQ
jgi:RHS repeat-associated protein